MKAWRLKRLGCALRLEDIGVPNARAGGVVVKVETSSLMSYMKDYVDGKLPVYHAPDGAFTPGGNGVGVVHEVGPGVWHLKPGQRVVLSSHVVTQENVPEPAQILLGITAAGPVAERLQSYWRDGTLAEFVEWPASAVTPVEELPGIDATQLAMAMRFVVPYGGLLRGRLAAGETLVVSGATGAYGAASVFLALAMGAARVVALGRRREALEPLLAKGGGRVVPVVTTGDVTADVAAIRAAAGRAPQMAFDMVGGARDANSTLAALRSLGREGRIVLMGSMGVDLPVPYVELMMNAWEIIGNFMYPRDAFARLFDLVRAGHLKLDAIEPKTYPLAELPAAMDAAAAASSLECVVMRHRQ